MYANFIVLTVTEQLYEQEWLGYVMAALNYIFGLALILMVLAVTIMTVVDIAYMTIPPFKLIYDAYDSKEHQGVFSKAVHFIVSKNAVGAYEEAIKTSKPLMLCYLKRSLMIYIIVAVICVVLVGGLPILTKIVYKLISGFM